MKQVTGISFYLPASNPERAYLGVEEVATSLSRVYSHSKNRNIGALTAFRGENSLKENRKRNEELKAMIRKAGYGFVKVKGRYIENEGTDEELVVNEESFMVIGDNTDDGAKHLDSFLNGAAKKFRQDSVLFKKHNQDEAHLVFYHGPAKGTSFPVGKWRPTNIGPYFSTLKKGKSFEFMSDSDKESVLNRKQELKKQEEMKKNTKSTQQNKKSPSSVTKRDTDWWNSKTKNEKKKYLEMHPTSKYKDLPLSDKKSTLRN